VPVRSEERPNAGSNEGALAGVAAEHRDLDTAINTISDDPSHDQLALTRMKRRKLLIKDQISWIERQLDPDIPA